MKKVLIITNHSFMFWQFRRELVAAMLEQGHQVTLALPFGDRAEDLRDLGCELIETPMDRRSINPLKEIFLIRLYRRILDRVCPDIVVTYSIKPNIYAGTACARRGIPYCINVQGVGTAFQSPVIAPLAAAMYRKATRSAKVVFFENEDNARMFREKNIVSGDKQVVLSGAGINLEHYAPQAYPENDHIRFLYLGRLMREKGVDELFSAVRRLHQDGEVFTLDLVGFFEENYRKQVAELVDLGICRFHGFQMETRPFYAGVDCIVLPSYHEGMSNVLLEAAAMARPLITSDVPGCREAVDQGISGYICPAKDAEALYQTMKQFLRLPREQREAMGIAGNAKMRAQFDKKNVVAQTLAAIFKES